MTGPQIECLCAGLSFILNYDVPDRPETVARSISRFTKSINTAAHFAHSELDATTCKRGLLGRFVDNDWQPPNSGWETRPEVELLWSQYRQAVLPATRRKPAASPIRAAVSELKANKNIYITSADKGGGLVTWDAIAYEREALRQLDDRTTYAVLDRQTLTDRLDLLHRTMLYGIGRLSSHQHVTANERKRMLAHSNEASLIYFLPKIHKDINSVSATFAGRPIVATFNSPTHLLDKYLAELTAPILPRIDGSLKDTTHLLTSLPTTPMPSGTRIVTADVNSLYPSIPWEEGIAACTDLYTAHLPWLKLFFLESNRLEPPAADLFRDLLTTVLTNSLIQYQGQRFYHQIKGTAMGCCVSVFFANAYMYSVTRRLIDNKPAHVVTFLRYIDDILLITTGFDAQIAQLFDSITNEHISYSISTASKSADFLDVTIIVEPITRLILTRPYAKATAVPFYLHAASMHPLCTVDSIPFAQLLRIKRISSTTEIYDKYAANMVGDFMLRGYRKSVLQLARKRCDTIPRAKLLQPVNAHQNNATASSFKIIRPYCTHYDWPLIKRIMNEMYGIIVEHQKSRGTDKPFVNNHVSLVFSKQNTIGSNFTRAFKHPPAQ